MTNVVTVEPTSEPITLDEALTHMRIDSHDEDLDIQRRITSARQSVEKFIRRSLITQTRQITLDDFPGGTKQVGFVRYGYGQTIYIDVGPVISPLTSVKYTDGAGATQTVAATNYHTDLVSTPARVKPISGYVWPTVQMGGLATVQVLYQAGYGDAADVPEPIKTGIKWLVAHLHEMREPTITGTIIAEIPLSIRDILGPYRTGVA